MRGGAVPVVLTVLSIPLLIAGIWALASEPTAESELERSSERGAAAPGAVIAFESALASRDERISTLEQRLAELEERVGTLALDAAGRTRIPLASAPGAVAAPATLEGGDDSLAALRKVALDSTRSTRDRVIATRRLWRIDLDTGMTGARTPEVVDALLALLATEPDTEMRKQICFSVLGAAGPEHKGPVLSALQFDVDAGVRAQAADTLQNLQSEPDVRAALEWASENDEAESVRETAAEMLRRWDVGGGH